MRSYTTLLAILLSWGGVAAPAYSQDDALIGIRVQKQTTNGPPSSASNLSPELLAVKLSGGKLVGNTSDGMIIVKDATDNGLQRLLASPVTKNVSKEKPKDQVAVERLRLSYEAGKKPTDEELKAMGLELVEDYAKGTFLIVKPSGPIDTVLLQKLEAAANVTLVSPVMKIKPIRPASGKKPAFNRTNAAPNDPRLTPCYCKKLEAAANVTLVSPVMKIKPIRPASGKKPAFNRTNAAPNDPRLSELWGMQNCRADQAWSAITGGKTVVAVIDTGVDYSHEDLESTMWVNPDEVAGDGMDNDGNGIIDDIYGADFVNNDGDPMDDHSHGTHCSGTISGAGNNGLGVVGVNWNTPIMALKWIAADGNGTSVEAIKCIDYAVEHGARVLSNSWWHPDDPELRDAIVRARDSGVLFVAAAGNFDMDNDEPTNFYRYPSSYDVENIISVLAIDISEAKADFSSYGATSVDIGGPGVDVLSSIPGDQYDYFSGTSMATPHVAGAAALLWNSAQNANASCNDIRNAILSHTRSVPTLAGKCATGGVLDLSFMNGGTNQVTATPFVVSKTIMPGEKTISRSEFLIAEIEVDVKAASMVVLTGNSSAHCIGDRMDTHLRGSAGDWGGDVRYLALAPDEWTGVTVTHSTMLPIGKHKLSWHGFVNEVVTFDGGSLSAVVVPIAASQSSTPSTFTPMRAARNATEDSRATRFDNLGRRPAEVLPRTGRQADTNSKEKRALRITMELAP